MEGFSHIRNILVSHSCIHALTRSCISTAIFHDACFFIFIIIDNETVTIMCTNPAAMKIAPYQKPKEDTAKDQPKI